MRLVLDSEPGNKPSSRLGPYATQARALFSVGLKQGYPGSYKSWSLRVEACMGTRQPRQLQELLVLDVS